MNQFLGRLKLLKLTKEEIHKSSTPDAIKEIGLLLETSEIFNNKKPNNLSFCVSPNF
jgi:hypothetical protein